MQRQVEHAVYAGEGDPEIRSLRQRLAANANDLDARIMLARAYEYVSEVMVENLMARDAEEGLSAFIDKRAPKWEDR